jgi:hypothetical protein
VAFGARALHLSEVAVCRKSDERAVPALVVSGPGLGRLRYIQNPNRPEPPVRESEAERPGTAPYEVPVRVRTIADRKEAYDRRRRQIVIDAVRDRLRRLAEADRREEAEVREGGPALTQKGLAAKTVALLSVLLSRHGWRREIQSGDGTWQALPDWRALGKLRNHDLGRDDLQTDLLARLWSLMSYALGICAVRLTGPVAGPDNAGQYTEAEVLCGLLDFDLAALRAEAAEKIPYAKAWRDEVADDWAAAVPAADVREIAPKPEGGEADATEVSA